MQRLEDYLKRKKLSQEAFGQQFEPPLRQSTIQAWKARGSVHVKRNRETGAVEIWDTKKIGEI